MSAGAVTLADIRSADWSLMLDSTAPGGAAGSGIGKVVEGIDDVAQCIGIILTTPPGSDPLRPTFACDLFSFIDEPINRALPAIVATVTEALGRWEPRIKVLKVAAAPVQPGDQGGAHLAVTVTWQLNLGGAPSAPRTTTVPIGG